jgi:hypothetical protein
MARSGIPLCGTGDGGMSEEEFKMPSKFTFDEFYEMLKEYVNDPKARELLAIYDAEDAKGRGELSDTSCSELAFDSYADFRMMGWAMLAKNGWPTYLEVIKIPNFQSRSLIESNGNNIWKIARRLIRKEPKQKGWDFQEYEFDVNDRQSVSSLLKMWQKRYSKHTEMPYFLTVGDE